MGRDGAGGHRRAAANAVGRRGGPPNRREAGTAVARALASYPGSARGRDHVSSAARSSPEVTVAVPVKDRRVQMLRCIDALLAQDHPSFEILVLDNESTDGTPDEVRRHV